MMLICPHCRKTYSDDNLFCPEDGNALVAENEQETVVNQKIPFTGGGGGYDPTINIPVGGGAAGGFTPQPPPQPTPQPNSGNNNLLFAIIGGCVVIIGVLVYFLASGPSQPEYVNVPGNNNKNSSPTPTASPAPTSEPRPANTSVPVNPPPTDPNPPPVSRPRIPEGVERTYRGTSYVNGNLPLTMTLERNGNSLNGSAVTPGDEDRLSGTIGPDGSFNLDGYNYKAGRVTGTWRGTISESGEINGTWYATNGRRVRFYAK